MNGHQRITSALRGEEPDRVPVMLHHFMMAAREAGVSMGEFRRNPGEMARAFIESAERYDLDGTMIDVDTAVLAGALGVPCELPEDEPAVCRGALLRSLDELDELAAPDVGRSERLQAWVEGVRLIKRHFGAEHYVRGNCDQAPFALACLLRGMEGFLMDIGDPENEEKVRRLLDYCEVACRQFLALMKESGCDMLSNGDSAGGSSVVSPRMHRRYAHPYERRLAQYSHELGLPWGLHVCGKTDPILEDLAGTGADLLELDSKTDAAKACEVFRGRTTFIGNIDPSGVLALGTPEVIRVKTGELCAAFRGNPRFILNAGCAIPAETPEENLRAMIEASRTGG
jgi:uroporphyrinogen decarboxylase